MWAIMGKKLCYLSTEMELNANLDIVLNFSPLNIPNCGGRDGAEKLSSQL